MRLRKREYANVNAPELIGVNNIYYRGALISSQSATYNKFSLRGAYNRQELCLDETHPGPPFRSGGSLWIFQWTDPVASPIDVGTYRTAWGTNYLEEYVGGFLPLYKWQSFGLGTCADFAHYAVDPTWNYSGNADAASYGATGWNRFRPGKPTADMGVFLGEFKDIPRMLKGTAKFFHDAWRAMGGGLSKPSKALANHWLNIQFGWLPFINDLRKAYKTYRNLDSQLQRIKRYNGRWQRRGGSIIDDTVSERISSSATATAHWPTLATKQYVNPSIPGSYAMSKVKITRAWFEGAFRYWIPDVESVYWSRRAVVELYGLMPNPALVWELTPFSWLADWVSNVGDVLSNMDNGWADNLAARYAYVMKSVEVIGELESFVNLIPAKLHHTWTFPISWKTRAGASPFGFGLTGSNFSARQWSILAALGVQYK